MNIKELISGNSFSLTQLNQMLSNPHSVIDSKIDFWGSRTLTVDGCSVNLSDITQRIYSIGDTILTNNVSLQERCSGVECVRKFRKYYETTDAEINKLNCISFCIFKLKAFFKFGDEKRHYNEFTGFRETPREKMQLYENFRGFTEEHFRATFPEERYLPSTGGEGLFYYKGSRMPDASDFCVF